MVIELTKNKACLKQETQNMFNLLREFQKLCIAGHTTSNKTIQWFQNKQDHTT